MIGPPHAHTHMKTHTYYQEIAIIQRSFIVLTNLLCLDAFLLSFSFFFFVILLLSLPPIIFLGLVDFSFSLHLFPVPFLFSSLLPPSCLSLFPPTPLPVFPTGVVIPSPQRRLNDFILPRLCLLLLMMCLVPSYFDVDYQSLLV